ncbi:hypothetical protein OTB20_30405 [Streptomyces sp. H27-H1]|uniref:hypothetical protein n=1 Tax=Streptomyces sp. H27-H1 TaxID=2996461 RepID=UPI002270348C|nr:hypothetical protein [Streptomyces sp. H27-H1]MCY0930427.1 hypothetical protein [Streptomyces sp. H27-H1]
MITRPSGEGPAADAGTGSTTDPTDPTAIPAAAGLGLLSLGGWLLTTTRPWQKPGSPLTLTLDWTASGTLMLCGLVLLARCIRTVHRTAEAPYAAPATGLHDQPDPTV